MKRSNRKLKKVDKIGNEFVTGTYGVQRRVQEYRRTLYRFQY